MSNNARLYKGGARLFHVIWLMVAVSAASGCSFVGGQSAPEGFTRASNSNVSVIYPATWSVVAEDKLAEHLEFSARQSQGKQVTGQIAINAGLTDTPDVVLASEAAISGPRRYSYTFERTTTESVEVPGADGARRIGYTYKATESGDSMVGTDVTVVGGGGPNVLVRITGTEKGLKDTVVEQVVDSIER